MKHDKKIDYMDVAARIAGFGIKREDLDLLVTIYELVIDKKGEANLSDALNVKFEIEKRQFEKDNIKPDVC